MNDFARPHHLSAAEGEGAYKVHYSAGLDDGLLVDFYTEEVHMEAASKEMGSPIFQTRIFTRIRFPSDSKKVVVHPVKGIVYSIVQDPDSLEYMTDWKLQDALENGDPTDPQRYPKAWNRFMKINTTADMGLPLEEWGAVPRSMAASLKAQGIHTVEALASLSDAGVQNIMGGNKYRDLAKAHLDERQRTRILSMAQETAERSNAKVNELQNTVQAQADVIAKMQMQLANMGGTAQPDMRNRQHSQELRQFEDHREQQAAAPATQIEKVSAKELKRRHKIPETAE